MPFKLKNLPGFSTLIDKLASRWFMVPYLSDDRRKLIVRAGNDPVRYGAMLLALETIEKEKITGSLAECGVYQGRLSKFVHGQMPGRKFYLFDTFAGFDERDSDTRTDERFKDTSAESVLATIGDKKNIVIRQGFFPGTAKGLEKEPFAFVVLDFDKYEPTLEGLKFFYDRVSKGGYIFVHDYNSPESNWACSRAVNEFLNDKPESPIAIPDAWGSVVFRKV